VTALDRLNTLPPADAIARLRDACGARRWAEAVAAARPFADGGALGAASEAAFDALGADDWEEAFAAHPRIGESAAASHQSERGRSWSAGEQSRAAAAGDGVRAALAEGNRRYAERFGRTYIVCATGRTAEELLAILESRLGNEPEEELRVATREQRRITRLRLDKMLAGGSGP
jgi:OHCU decarboxylase